MGRWRPPTQALSLAFLFDRFIFGKPKIERVQVRFINDPNTVLANILGGEVHGSVDFAARYEQAATLLREWANKPGREKGVVVARPSLFWKTSFQFRPEVVNSRFVLGPRVRRALAHGFDKQGINDALMGGLSVITETVVSPKADYYPQVERVLTKRPFDIRLLQRGPVIPHYFTLQVMPHVAALKGPVARELPDAGIESFNIWQWEWQY